MRCARLSFESDYRGLSEDEILTLNVRLRDALVQWISPVLSSMCWIHKPCWEQRTESLIFCFINYVRYRVQWKQVLGNWRQALKVIVGIKVVGVIREWEARLIALNCER